MGEVIFQTNDGKRAFAPGDRIVFLENDRDLGVKNGMLGTVERVEADRASNGIKLVAVLDGKDRAVSVPVSQYKAFDHGYATTIHKSQGATVERAFVMASSTMDRHMTYVAMTRHRENVELYGSREEFVPRPNVGSRSGAGFRTGKFVAHGKAPYENQPGNHDSYFVTLQNDQGQQHTVWGVDLERAIRDAAPEIGAQIALERKGSETVRLPDGRTAERNSWKVLNAQDLAYSQMEARLSRSGAKETTLDYAAAFAERRGLAEHLGVKSEIEVPPERAELHGERQTTAERIEDDGTIYARKVDAALTAEQQHQVGQEGEKEGYRRISWSEVMRSADAGAGGQQQNSATLGFIPAKVGDPAPLIPAITDHARSVEDVASEKAMPAFEHQWQTVEWLAKEVYVNPGAVTDRMRHAITVGG